MVPGEVSRGAPVRSRRPATGLICPFAVQACLFEACQIIRSGGGSQTLMFARRRLMPARSNAAGSNGVPYQASMVSCSG